MALGFFISLLTRHFTQYACIVLSPFSTENKPFLTNLPTIWLTYLYPNSVRGYLDFMFVSFHSSQFSIDVDMTLNSCYTMLYEYLKARIKL